MKGFSCIALLTLLISLPASAATVVIGHPDGVNSIDQGTLNKLYLGKSTKINGSTAKLFEQAKGSADRVAFHQVVTGRTDAQLQSNWSRLVFSGKAEAPFEMSDPSAIVQAVATTPNSIAYVDAALVTDKVKVLLTF